MLEHVTNPVKAAYVGNLMRVRNNRRGTVRQHRFGKLAGRHHRRLDMHMRIDQSRRHKSVVKVDLLNSAVLPDADDPSAVNGNIARQNLFGENIDDPAVLQHQFRHFPACCKINLSFQFGRAQRSAHFTLHFR